MPVHLVLRADGEALDVPAADQRLPRLGLGEAAVLPERLDEAAQLGRRRDVRADQPARHERVRDRRQALPRREHVEDDPVDVALGRGRRRGRRSSASRPGGRRRRTTRRCARAMSANSSRRSYDVTWPSGADRAQQRAGQRARPDAGLDHVRAGEDVGHRDDLGGVLGVDDGGAAWHRHDEVGEQRPQHEVLDAAGRRHHDAVGPPDQRVVLDRRPCA